MLLNVCLCICAQEVRLVGWTGPGEWPHSRADSEVLDVFSCPYFQLLLFKSSDINI